MFQSPILHRFFRIRRVAAILLALAPVTAGAEPVTEQDFLSGIGDEHPSVVALTERLAKAEGDRRGAGLWANPSFEFEYEAPENGVDQSTFKLGWQPPLDGRRGLAVRAARVKVEAAQHDLAAARLRLTEHARATFADWAVAQRRRDLIADHHQTLLALQRRLDVRAERGEESRLAAQRFALAVTELRVELAGAQSDLARARGNAGALREDLSANASPVLPDPPPVPAAVSPSMRPDLEALRREREAAQLGRRLLGRVVEFPSLVVGWTRVSAAEDASSGPYLGLAWEAPLFDRNQGERTKAGRALAISEARLRLAEREASARLDAAFSSFSNLHATLVEVTAVTREAPETAQAASASFLAGESSMTDLLETLRSVLHSQLAALDLQARVLAAHRDLEWNLGSRLPRGENR